MADLVVDASVVIKWMVEEVGSDEAAALLKAGRTLCAPDLLVAECANILWKKVRLDELKLDEADSMANLIQRAAIEMVPMRSLMAAASRSAAELRRRDGPDEKAQKDTSDRQDDRARDHESLKEGVELNTRITSIRKITATKASTRDVIVSA